MWRLAAGRKPPRMDASRRLFLLSLAVALALSALSLPPSGRAMPQQGLVLRGAWARPAQSGATDAGYLRIDNSRSDQADTLVGAESPVAGQVSIHESRLEGQVMIMRPLKTVAVPARSTVALAPGGLHLMLTSLKRPLRLGDRFAMTLVFAKAGNRVVEFLVSPGPPGGAVPPVNMKM